MSIGTGTRTGGMPLHTKVLLGLLIGATLGVALNVTLGGEHPVVAGLNQYLANPVGQIFLRMLFMIVVPLVFASITLGVAGLGDVRRVGRVGGKALWYFLFSTVLSAATGILIVQLLRPGTRVPADVRDGLLATYAGDASSRVEAATNSTFGIQTFIDIVPRNPFASAVNLDLLGLIFFGIVFGAALTMIAAERARPMIAVLESLNDVVVKIVEFAMKLAPYGVTALIFGVTSRFGWTLLQPLGFYVAAVIGALAFHAFVTNSVILRMMVGISPRLFFSRVRESMVTSFSTSSSSATLPTNIAVAEKNLGIPPTIAGFVLPMGSTMCMNGTSMFEGITVLFLANVFGVDLSLTQQIVVVTMCTITAVGAAGVPGGSIPLLVGILAMFGIPPEGIAIILGVDRILDMSRTTVNVLGDLVAASWVAKSEGVWTAAMVPAIAGLSMSSPLDETPGQTLVTDADIRPPRG